MAATEFDPAKFTEQSKKAWSETAEAYDRLSAAIFAEFTPAFGEFAELKAGERVLDVACGPGLASFEAARRVGPSGSVTAVDLAPGMIEASARKKKASGLGPLRFLEMNAERLDFGDGSFDAVVCQLGLMLFADPGRALREMVRVARPGGRVACLVQGDPERMLLTSLLNRIVFRLAPQLKVPGAPNLYAFGAPGALEKAFEQAGLVRLSFKRLEGEAEFDSPEVYWSTLAESSGRLKTALATLDEALREKIRLEVLDAAGDHAKGGRLRLPYEVALAKGFKP